MIRDVKSGRFRIGGERFLTGRGDDISIAKVLADRKTTKAADRRSNKRRATDKVEKK